MDPETTWTVITSVASVAAAFGGVGAVIYTEPEGSPSAILVVTEDWPGSEMPFELHSAPRSERGDL